MAPVVDERAALDVRDLSALAEWADGTEQALGDLLGRGLEWLGRLIPYDLACVFELTEGQVLAVRAARGPLMRAEVRHHQIALSQFPSIQAAIEEQRGRVFAQQDHAEGDGDPFDGLMDFPHGHSCMVVPIVAGVDAYGILTVDRRECVPVAPSVVHLAEVFARMLALNIRSIRQSAELAKLRLADQERIEALQRQLVSSSEQSGILQTSRHDAVNEVSRNARLVAQTGSTVLLIGETGTGKEHLARFIHQSSPKRDRPFVPVNSAALPAQLLESELFGYERGAFTGASRSRGGLFRAADGGTLFLDEVGEIPLELQAKLLRALQEGEILPVGSDRPVRVDVRIVAATNVHLEESVRKGRFREDLYYRLSVFPIRLVPLRDRLLDLPDLAAELLGRIESRVDKRGLSITRRALRALSGYAFPGNIRELGNILERAAISANRTVIDESDLTLPRKHDVSLLAGEAHIEADTDRIDDGSEPFPSLEDAERRHIARALARTKGRIYGAGGAAALLGLPPTTLQSRMKRLGIGRSA